MKDFRIYVVALLMCTLPVSGTWAAFPELPPVASDGQAWVQEAIADMAEVRTPVLDLHFFDGGAHGLGARLAELLFAPPSPAEEELETLIGEEIESLRQEELLVEGAPQPFWTRRKFLMATSLLLVTGLVVGLVAMFSGSGSGSGDSSGSGAGGGSNFGDSGIPPSGEPANPQGPQDEAEDPNLVPGGGGPIGGPGDAGSGGGPFVPPVNAPANPEPSTFLLAALGLLIPLLRKRGA